MASKIPADVVSTILTAIVYSPDGATLYSVQSAFPTPPDRRVLQRRLTSLVKAGILEVDKSVRPPRYFATNAAAPYLAPDGGGSPAPALIAEEDDNVVEDEGAAPLEVPAERQSSTSGGGLDVSRDGVDDVSRAARRRTSNILLRQASGGQVERRTSNIEVPGATTSSDGSSDVSSAGRDGVSEVHPADNVQVSSARGAGVQTAVEPDGHHVSSGVPDTCPADRDGGVANVPKHRDGDVAAPAEQPRDATAAERPVRAQSADPAGVQAAFEPLFRDAVYPIVAGVMPRVSARAYLHNAAIFGLSVAERQPFLGYGMARLEFLTLGEAVGLGIAPEQFALWRRHYAPAPAQAVQRKPAATAVEDGENDVSSRRVQPVSSDVQTAFPMCPDDSNPAARTYPGGYARRVDLGGRVSLLDETGTIINGLVRAVEQRVPGGLDPTLRAVVLAASVMLASGVVWIIARYPWLLLAIPILLIFGIFALPRLSAWGAKWVRGRAALDAANRPAGSGPAADETADRAAAGAVPGAAEGVTRSAGDAQARCAGRESLESACANVSRTAATDVSSGGYADVSRVGPADVSRTDSADVSRCGGAEDSRAYRDGDVASPHEPGTGLGTDVSRAASADVSTDVGAFRDGDVAAPPQSRMADHDADGATGRALAGRRSWWAAAVVAAIFVVAACGGWWAWDQWRAADGSTGAATRVAQSGRLADPARLSSRLQKKPSEDAARTHRDGDVAAPRDPDNRKSEIGNRKSIDWDVAAPSKPGTAIGTDVSRTARTDVSRGDRADVSRDAAQRPTSNIQLRTSNIEVPGAATAGRVFVSASRDDGASRDGRTDVSTALSPAERPADGAATVPVASRAAAAASGPDSEAGVWAPAEARWTAFAEAPFPVGTVFSGSIGQAGSAARHRVALEITRCSAESREVTAVLRNNGGWTDVRTFEGAWDWADDYGACVLTLRTQDEDRVADGGPLLETPGGWGIVVRIRPDGTATGSPGNCQLKQIDADAAAAVRADFDRSHLAVLAATRPGTLYRGTATSRSRQTAEPVLLRFTAQDGGPGGLQATLESTTERTWRRPFRGAIIPSTYRADGRPIRLQSHDDDRVKAADPRTPLGLNTYANGLMLRLRVDGNRLVGEDDRFAYVFAR